MARKQDKVYTPAPFLIKTYEMLDDTSTDNIVSWSDSGSSFVVWNPNAFSQNLLPKFFKHSNFSSFVRQLNTYGFRKIDPEQWEFANADFVKGKRSKIGRIHRRKPVHSHSNGGEYPVADEERLGFVSKIESLEMEKRMLEMKVEDSERKKEELNRQVTALGHRLCGIEARQTRLVQLFEGKKRKVVKEEQDGLFCEERVERIEMSLALWEGVFEGGGCGYGAMAAVSGESSSSRLMEGMFLEEGHCGGVFSDSVDEVEGINDQFWQHFLTEESCSGYM